MSYAFDTSGLSALFRNYYRSVFRTLWTGFDQLVANGKIISTREVLREIEDSSLDNLREWAAANKDIFVTPTPEEAAFVARIYQVRHFQQNIEMRKLLSGGNLADPFIIARAAIAQASVVTTEKIKPHAAKIPNICEHFQIPCLSLEEFMQKEGWTF
jgi:Domain of unknown function (DUF4411)